MSELSHIDENNQPGMVNVGHKKATHRVARARAVVVLPPPVIAQLCEGELSMPKGPVFETAIIAGTMAAKKTSDLIPLCHPLGLDGCKIHMGMNDADEVVIEATCEITHKTGVEMEALTAVSVAALTVYDMCKALSHDIVIKDIRLVEKTGGKSSFGSTPEGNR
jgi:cyclic pyranopterin phosphate synthase